MYAKNSTTVIDNREMLRVKLINLMQEAKLIRVEERRTMYVRNRDLLVAHAIQQATDAGIKLSRRNIRRIGRRETTKTWNPLYVKLREHRTRTVRSAARLVHLAYGAIRGLRLEQMEKPGSCLLTDWQKEEIFRMFDRYGKRGAAVPEWMVTEKVTKQIQTYRGRAVITA